jgi:hypothetical protein
VALITFTVGLAAVFVWLYGHGSSSDTAPAINSAEANLQLPPLTQRLLDRELRSRDMSLYDQAGEYCCGGLILESKRPQYAGPIAEARSFIWQQWNERRRGYITVTFYGEDNVDTAHFFIEPNGGGEWRIRCRILRDESYGDDLAWQSVKWRRAKKYDGAQRGTPVLAFINEKGEEEFAF